ncbi:pentatricopeptide repeat-containing protein At1g26900, mitochondrial [Prosopis cineraria]|uniref:pentatricopeptide repeat-containing protein At1g26900, mitochondrial n=1 Tax=Prosopis cineraria TaxID=364024 RepID=UPI00240ED871|nr:pentatricopeptide repeat-containing protein At1g26900, mitochondrial [Prosopis cineraria]
MTLGNAFWLRYNFGLYPRNLNVKSYSILALDQELISLLKSCKMSSETNQIHGYMVKTGLDSFPFNLGKLLAASIRDIEHAASIFSYIQNPNLYMFNTMLRGYSFSDYPKQTFMLFNNLRARGIVLDEFSFITTLKACGRALETGIGQGIHGIALKSGHMMFIDVKNSLLHFYCVCKRIEDGHKLFDEFPAKNDLVSWNTLMGGYVLVFKPTIVLDLFRKMCCVGLKASVATILCLSTAFGNIASVVLGKSLHGHCLRIGFGSDLNVLTSLIDIYAKTGHIYQARKIFDGLVKRDVVLWNCLIGNYGRIGLVEEALSLMQQMRLQGVKPNSSTLSGLLSACPASGAIQVGQYVSSYMEEERLKLDPVLGTALVDMYAKCGFLNKALDIFERMESKDVKSWTAMITGYGVHGQPTNVIRLFNRMEKEGFRPNEVTFLAVLSSCSHGGLVMEGTAIFERMVREYGFLPQVEHYGCLIDLLGRAGMLEEAHKLIKSLPIKSDATAWRTLLAACRVYGNIKLGECVKEMLRKMYKEHPADSLLISSTYAVTGRLSDLPRTEGMKEADIVLEKRGTVEMKREKMVKEAGLSIIEVYNQE